MEEILITVAIAVVEMIASVAISEAQQKSAEVRSAHETKVRGIFSTIKDRFNITLDQLNTVLSKMDLKLNQLTDSTRGSARLSRASQIARKYITAYPGMVDRVNKVKNTIQNAINNLSSKENEIAGRIQSRETVTGQDVLNAVDPYIDTVNSTLVEYNNNNNDNNNGEVSTIDTKLNASDASTPDNPWSHIKPIQWTGGYH